MIKTAKMFAVGLMALSLAGCTVRLIDFTAISSKNCDIPGTRGERTEGRDLTWILLGFPLGGPPNLKEAVDRAIEKGGGDCLVDGVLYQKAWSALVIGQVGFVVEGTVVNTRRK